MSARREDDTHKREYERTTAMYADKHRVDNVVRGAIRAMEGHASNGRQILRRLWDDKDDPESSPAFQGRAASFVNKYGVHNARLWARIRFLMSEVFDGEALSDDDLIDAVLGVALVVAEDGADAAHELARYKRQAAFWRERADQLANQLATKQKAKPGGTRRITPAMRAEIFKRDKYECLACGATENLSIDHIIPFSQGGACHVDNFQTLCRSCNSRKRATFVDLRAA